MIVRRCLALTIPVCLILSVEFGAIKAERWSRQVSNSEWIPLASPRATQTQIEQSSQATGLLPSGISQLSQIPSLSLPPALQQQYQEQLLQLQKTQESIQKLLLLQQQLRAQQQLLQSQAFLPSGFSNSDEEKRLQQGGLGNTPTELTTEDLVPPLPASETLPPVFSPQNFLPQRPRVQPAGKQDPNIAQEFISLPGQGFKSGHGIHQEHSVEGIQENPRQGAKHLKESHQTLVQQAENGQDEEEEVQLVYVPAETLAQRGQKRGRGRKQYPLRSQQHQHRENQGADAGLSSNDQDAFARQVLQQIQMEREEKVQLLNEERTKEIARLNEEQRALERKTRLQQEALQREQELQRQREAEKKKKELEKLEEMAKQRELERIREAREKQRLEELERRRLAEIRAREEKRRADEAARQREAERLAALERQKQLEIEQALKQQQILEKQREDEARATSPSIPDNEDPSQALPLIRDQQLHRQHLTETSKPYKSKTRGRHRQRNQYQEQQSYREPTTTPSPNQPPLSVYMGSSSPKSESVKVADVLKILKDAKTIAVVDTVGPDTPQVFVGPTNLDPPNGYAKFDLPYLSSIDHNRVERKVDKLPFFVAPLSFDPPPGYSKIPFPAPHIGSVVVNTLDNTDPKDGDDQNPSPTPLIEPNSYIDSFDGGSESTTALYEPQTTPGYSQEPSSTPKYEQTYSTPSSGYSGSRFRFRQFYGDNKPATVISTSYYDDQRPTTRKHKYFEDNLRTTESPLHSGKVEVSHVDEVAYSTTPSYKEGPVGPPESSRSQDYQLSLVNEELNRQREAQRYNTGGQYSQQGSQSTGLGNSFDGDVRDISDVRSPVGPTQYNLPAELPAISPHLPGLVNSLLDKNEAKHQGSTAATTTTTTSTTTTTTTTPRTPTTTYRPRGRQRNRVVTTRPRTTTQATYTRTTSDRSRRPYNRSRSRFTTTTEEYRETYEPTKSRIPETTLRYNAEQRRTSTRNQKYRTRDKPSQQAEVVAQGHNTQTQQVYENISPGDSGSSSSGNGFLQPSAPETTLRQLDPSLNEYTPGNYPSTTVSTTENYPSLTVSHGAPSVSEDYSRSQDYPQNLAQDPRYPGTYDQSTLEQIGVEKTPVNGFNYQLQNGDTIDQGFLQRPKDYHLDGKAENSDYELATTPDPRLRNPEEQRYSSIYEVNLHQTQPEYSLTGQDNFSQLGSEKVQTGAVESNPNEPPIFVPLPENKQEDYELPVSSTESPLTDVTKLIDRITTEATTASTTPLIIRQRVRGRVGTRVHHDSSIQTRPRGSQDEYVRFNVVNQDSSRSSPNRQRTRSRTRSQNQESHVQTEGNGYIKFHAVQQKQVATTTPAPSTITTEKPAEEDIDYGFIRPPNFRPVHPVDNRFQAPVTYRPPLPEVPQQSLLPNDETAVESSPQLLKNRQKYQATPNRRLPGKATTLSPPTAPETTTTTERIPVATALPDDAIYTVRPKSRPDDAKQIRVRGRIRRPGRKRVTTTTTTESTLDSNNELPLDENYPRVRPQVATTEQQQTLYDDSYDGAPQFPSSRNPTSQQFYETSSENYPSDFILNFGNYPDQPVQRDEYDQSQLASSAPAKYSEPAGARPGPGGSHSTASDIYGSESQWSTKLTWTSFQPSFAVNRLPGEPAKDQEWLRESLKDTNAPEIITAAPDVSSVTLLVSSDDKRSDEEDESVLMGTTVFGKKTSLADHTENMNATTSVTGRPTTGERNGSEMDRSTDSRLTNRPGNLTEQAAFDFERTEKKNIDSPAVRKGTRRRKVRVRVRPAVDDFVTAESQHFNSAINGLVRDQYKYNPIRESKPPSGEAAQSLPQKSLLQDFLTEILRNDRPSTTSTTTELPETAWTMSPAITTAMNIPDDSEETTTMEVTTLPTTEKPEETTITQSSYDFMAREEQAKMEKEKTEEKNWEPTKSDNWEKNSLQNSLDLGFLSGKYTTKENDINKLNDDSDASNGELSLPRTRLKPINGESIEGTGKEQLSDVSEESKDNYAYPKNHRAKWSEVRYPSNFDQSQASAWSYNPRSNTKSVTSIPGLVTKNEGDASVKTLSDYVQAIFDSMKSAEEETTVSTTEKPEETTTQMEQLDNEEESKTTMNDLDVEVTTMPQEEEAETSKDLDGNDGNIESTTVIDSENATTLERASTTGSSSVSLTTDPATTTPMPSSTTVASNSTESILGKVLRTSTTTKVSHMTEICYRGRCVMTRPSQEDRSR